MNYDSKFKKVTVLGAGGKMGKGIFLLAAIEMYKVSIRTNNTKEKPLLIAFDISEKALSGFMEYIKYQLNKIAEKQYDYLQNVYSNCYKLTNKSDIVNEFIITILSYIKTTTDIRYTYNSHLIFEAVNENPELKVKLLSQIKNNSNLETWFFTNTSSIPISFLNAKADLKGKILGVHFYNPPVIQKLVEVIKCDESEPTISEFISKYIKNINKIEVHANDSAGFIGNGHFIRDALFGISLVKRLSLKMNIAEAIYCTDKITRDFLIRPMGIFQLIDYVGIEVCQLIMNVMNIYHKEETIHSSIIDKMIELGIKGGQNHDGSQKDGFMKYCKGKITAIWNINNKEYIPVEKIIHRCDSFLGSLPEGHTQWKSIIQDDNKNEILSSYFMNMKNNYNNGSLLSIEYLKKSKEIGLQLIKNKVANNENDVNTVLKTGFYHAYGPINNFID